MAITGIHALLYTPEADALRSVLSDVFGFDHVDAGDGWLIYALPPAEMGIHPGDEPAQEITLMCSDIVTTIADLEAKGIEFKDDPDDQGWGVVTTMVLPGGVEMLLYEPRHATAIS